MRSWGFGRKESGISGGFHLPAGLFLTEFTPLSPIIIIISSGLAGIILKNWPLAKKEVTK